MNVQDNIKILDEEITKLSTEKMTPSLAQSLNTYFGAKNAIESLVLKDGKSAPTKQNEPAQEVTDVVGANKEELFPTLQEFRQNHTERNLNNLTPF